MTSQTQDGSLSILLVEFLAAIQAGRAGSCHDAYSTSQPSNK